MTAYSHNAKSNRTSKIEDRVTVMANDTKDLMADVNDAMTYMDGPSINPEIFARTGIAIVRSALSSSELSRWITLWDDYRRDVLGSQREIENQNNPVEIKQLPEELYELSKDPSLMRLLEPVFGENIGLYQKRFVVKDSNSKQPVILHQDSGYHVGTFEKASMFLALKKVNKDNGGMYLYPGTHRFGYLGDAGSINPEIVPENWPVITPELDPGDFMLMRSLTWHGSGSFETGDERVMTDFIYQPASDPSTKEIVHGKTGWSGSFLTERRSAIFNMCRSSKLREIKNVLDSTT